MATIALSNFRSPVVVAKQLSRPATQLAPPSAALPAQEKTSHQNFGASQQYQSIMRNRPLPKRVRSEIAVPTVILVLGGDLLCFLLAYGGCLFYGDFSGVYRAARFASGIDINFSTSLMELSICMNDSFHENFHVDV